MKKRKTNPKNYSLSMIIALIIACMMIICLPIVCEADDGGGDNHIGTGKFEIIPVPHTSK